MVGRTETGIIHPGRDPVSSAQKNDSSETPIGNIEDGLGSREPGRQIVSEVIPRQEIGFRPAKRTRKETIGLRQEYGGSALRAWVFDFPRGIRLFHRTDCNKSIRADYPCRNGDTSWTKAFLPPDAHTGDKTFRGRGDSSRTWNIAEKRGADARSRDRTWPLLRPDVDSPGT